MKKWMYGLFIGLFMVMCLLPVAGMLVAGPSQPVANEVLAEAPSLTGEDGKLNAQVLSDTVRWVGDHFFLRNELISWDRKLNASLLATSTQESVVLGKDGWLYFRPTVADYTGTEGMTERQLQHAASNLALMDAYCRENGKQFLFVIAPNKNALYDDNMPSFGVKAQQTDALRLHSLLQEKGVSYCDLFAAFDRQEEVLYFAHDSHWNSKGAALGADEINRAFGVESSFFTGDFSAAVAHEGDLYTMLYPGSTDLEQDPVYGGKLDFAYATNATRPDAIRLKTTSAASGRLLAYRDSFGNLLYPYLASSYGEATFSRSTTYDLTVEADFVLVELVQRNLRYLITNIPTMLSPTAEICPATAVGVLEASSATKGELLQVTGTLPTEADAAFVVCDSGVYQAFMLEANGFAVNVPAGSSAEAVVYTIGGETRMYELTFGGK